MLEEGTPFTVRADGKRDCRAGPGDPGPSFTWSTDGDLGEGDLAAFVAPLLAAGYQVVTHDAPGHGASGFGHDVDARSSPAR